MSWVGQAMLCFHNWKNGVTKVKGETVKTAKPLRIGILGAAAINYTALIDPVETHPDVVVAAIAARSQQRAQAQIDANKLGVDCKAYGSYQDLINDNSIDAIYNPLPNGLHAEWSIKAMKQGKHVLIEKPIASNAREARRIKQVSVETGCVVLEAFHWRFHPMAIRLKQIIDSGKYGKVTGFDVKFVIVQGMLAKDDIRFQYDLAGGASMDLTYVYSACRYFTGDTGDITITEAKPRLHRKDSRVDEAMDVSLTINRPGKPIVNCHCTYDAAKPAVLGVVPRVWELMPTVTIELERARIVFPGFVQPAFAGGFTIQEKDVSGKLLGQKLTDNDMVEGFQELYGDCDGQLWWTTYRWQLEAFVGKIRMVQAGREWTGPWVTMEQSIGQMETIDSVYDKAGLPRRGEGGVSVA